MNLPVFCAFACPHDKLSLSAVQNRSLLSIIFKDSFLLCAIASFFKIVFFNLQLLNSVEFILHFNNLYVTVYRALFK